MKNTINLQNPTFYNYMKSFIEILLAWLIGTVMPLLVYFQMIFWLIVADCTLGTWIAIQNKQFKWSKFFTSWAKGAAFAILLVAFQKIQEALQIPSIEVLGIHVTVAFFIAGIMAGHLIDSLEQKTIALWGFAFLKPLKSKFTILKEFDAVSDTKP